MKVEIELSEKAVSIIERIIEAERSNRTIEEFIFKRGNLDHFDKATTQQTEEGIKQAEKRYYKTKELRE